MPRGYALVIGVGEYRNLDEGKQLRFARSDAEAMYRVLISQEGGAFPPENVRLLTGARATLANIREALEDWLPSVATPADRVVVYFAGHGFVHEGRGYLAPADVEPGRLEETAYPMSALGDVMANRVQARWKVLLTDACHSGKINAETTNEGLDLEFGNLPHSFLTLTASREREQSHEDPGLATGFGFFTYFLTQAWQGHADNDPCDGRITADEVIEYVRTNVRRYARDRLLAQTPTARGDYDPAMLLGVGTACLGTVDPESPSLLGTAIVETNMDDVDLYIDGDLVGTLSRDRPLTIPRLSSGVHEFTGVREGYAPDTKEIMIPPGQEVTVTLRIRYPRRIRRSARELGERGERLLFSRRSTVNPLNLLPVSRSQTTEDLERARELFDKALAEDPAYGKAAYHLGQVHHLLGDYERSEEAYRSALTIDPSDVEARVQLGAVLLESGDPDAAIRELTDAARLEATDELYAMVARAYWDKGAWAEALSWAREAIARDGSNAQAHLWKADALRQMAAEAGSGDGADRAVPNGRRGLPHLPEADELRVVARRETGVPLHRLRSRPAAACGPGGGVAQPAHVRLPRPVHHGTANRQSAPGARVLPAGGRLQRARPHRPLPAGERQPGPVQRPPDLRVPLGRCPQLRPDARAERTPRRVRERAELPRTDHRHRTTTRLLTAEDRRGAEPWWDDDSRGKQVTVWTAVFLPHLHFAAHVADAVVAPALLAYGRTRTRGATSA